MNGFKNNLTILLLFVLAAVSNAQQNTLPVGARAAGMANAFVAVSDFWSVYHNQAGIASLRGLHVGVHHENRFFTKDLNLGAAAIALNTKPGTIAVNYSLFGFSQYHENRVGLAFARAFGEKLKAGVQLDYFNISQPEDYGNAQAICVEGGLIVQPTSKFSIGAHVFNPTRSKLENNDLYPLPSNYKLGVALTPSEKALFTLDAEKDIDEPLKLKAGTELEMLKNLKLRFGVAGKPFEYAFGLGYTSVKFDAGLGFRHHPVLGFMPHLSLVYRIREVLN